MNSAFEGHYIVSVIPRIISTDLDFAPQPDSFDIPLVDGAIYQRMQTISVARQGHQRRMHRLESENGLADSDPR
jgi:hypothetical protein